MTNDNKYRVFVSPHVDDFIARPIHYKILRRRPLEKWKHLRQDGKLYVLINTHTSTLLGRHTKYIGNFLALLLNQIELLLWSRVNKIEYEVVRDLSQLNTKRVIAFSYKALNSCPTSLVKVLQNSILTLHMTHFWVDLEKKQKIVQKLNPDYLAFESEDIFRHVSSVFNIENEDRCLTMKPKSMGINSLNIQNTNDKKNYKIKVAAIGTFHRLDLEANAKRYKAFLEYCSHPTLHVDRYLCSQIPSEDKIFGNFVFPIKPYGKFRYIPFGRYLEKFLVGQKEYFSLNLKEIMIDTKYVIPGIDLFGQPSIVAYEALAHGCRIITTPELYGLWPVEFRKNITLVKEFTLEEFSALD